jgi:hypothetical protein
MNNRLSEPDKNSYREAQDAHSCSTDVLVAKKRGRFNRAIRHVFVGLGAATIVLGVGARNAGCHGCESEGTIHRSGSEKSSENKKSGDERRRAHSPDDPIGPKPSSIDDHMDLQRFAEALVSLL